MDRVKNSAPLPTQPLGSTSARQTPIPNHASSFPLLPGPSLARSVSQESSVCADSRRRCAHVRHPGHMHGQEEDSVHLVVVRLTAYVVCKDQDFFEREEDHSLCTAAKKKGREGQTVQQTTRTHACTTEKRKATNCAIIFNFPRHSLPRSSSFSLESSSCPSPFPFRRNTR